MELWQELDQVESALIEAAADVGFGDVVAAVAHTGCDAREVGFGAVEARVPDADLMAGGQRLLEPRHDGAAAERGLEVVVETFANGALELPYAELPGERVGGGLLQLGVALAQLPRDLIGIEVVTTALAQHGARDAALACAVGAGEHPDARSALTHGAGELLLRRGLGARAWRRRARGWRCAPWAFACA